MIIQKTKVKKLFSENGVQLPNDSLELINDHLERSVLKMARRCKEGNVKRLLPRFFHIALGRLWNG